MTAEEIINYVFNENPKAAMFTNPDFKSAIIGYAENTFGHSVFVYDYDKMIESLVGEYMDEEDPVTDAIDWIEYNTLRTIPYINEDGRPIIVYG